MCGVMSLYDRGIVQNETPLLSFCDAASNVVVVNHRLRDRSGWIPRHGAVSCPRTAPAKHATRRSWVAQASPTPTPLKIGNIELPYPVVLSPMAGVTNYPFRKLCASYGAALYVSEMVLAKSVVEGKYEARCRFGPDERVRSAQLLGSDPAVMGAAAARLIEEQGVHHIDLNFGCPARKVVEGGGGAAIPGNLPLLRQIVSSVVDAARPHNVPVTTKMRLGMDKATLNYVEAGLVMQECGVAAVTLHARTVEDMYDEGAARSNVHHIELLSDCLDVPVLGNGDIFTATDALRMIKSTGAAGVVIGRGCLGRPWLFKDLADAFRTKWATEATVPMFDTVATTMMDHLKEAVAWQAQIGVSEKATVQSMRKWFGWYWKGYNGVPDAWVPRMCKQDTIAGVESVLYEADPRRVSYDIRVIITERGKVTKRERKRVEPLRPEKPRKSASQRLAKTEKGKRQRQEKFDAIMAKYEAQKERLRLFREIGSRPRRRAHAQTVKDALARQGARAARLKKPPEDGDRRVDELKTKAQKSSRESDTAEEQPNEDTEYFDPIGSGALPPGSILRFSSNGEADMRDRM